MTEQQFIEAVQSAIDAPSKSGTKWNTLEKLFADNGLRGNGALNNGGGADRTTRARQLGTSKLHNGHQSREVASHSVFVIGGGTVANYNQDPAHYLDQIEQALKDEHPNLETCLIVVAAPDTLITPVRLVKRSEQEFQIPYETWWPNLDVTILQANTDRSNTKIEGLDIHSGLTGTNVIFFGPPVRGKSTEIKMKVSDSPFFRTQFHPEYNHSDFFGSYRPVVGYELDNTSQILSHDGNLLQRPINYFAFVPGPLTLALECAFTTEKHVFLVIEEINRGDCAAIFGDAFQLLDRDDSGRSEFGVTLKHELLHYFKTKTVNFDIAGDGKLYLPSNLSLLATMNTSDQSLYPMDSAFKRRWQWISCPIDFEQLLAYTSGARPFIDDGRLKWDWIKFLEQINNNIVRERMEDKQIGPWFIKPAQNGLIPWDGFLNKCLFYLWHDVFKDEQSSDLSPFKSGGPAFFSEVQANIRDNGMLAGLKRELLISILDPESPDATEAIETQESFFADEPNQRGT